MSSHADLFATAPRKVAARDKDPRSAVLTPVEWIVVGSGAGLSGGLLMALPLVVWDWMRSAHLAFELPTATAAWLFGLDHFSHRAYHSWPLVIGISVLCLYWIASGIAFTGLADRVYHAVTLGTSVIAGAAWGFVSFVFFWYMVLPIARGGAPFRATAAAPGLFVAPNWVWILAFTVFGIATGIAYAALRPRR